MSIKYTNLTYNELRELAPKDKPFQVVVQSNPYGNGSPKVLWACIIDNDLSTDFIDQAYAYNPRHWNTKYNGTFNLIIHHFDDTTLEQFKVGDEVEVLYSPKLTGQTFRIVDRRLEDNYSINYVLDVSNTKLSYLSVPQNCLRKVVSKKIELKTITIGNKTYPITEELTNALKNLKEVD